MRQAQERQYKNVSLLMRNLGNAKATSARITRKDTISKNKFGSNL